MIPDDDPLIVTLRGMRDGEIEKLARNYTERLREIGSTEAWYHIRRMQWVTSSIHLQDSREMDRRVPAIREHLDAAKQFLRSKSKG